MIPLRCETVLLALISVLALLVFAIIFSFFSQEFFFSMDTQSERLHLYADGRVYEIESIGNGRSDVIIKTTINILAEFDGLQVVRIQSSNHDWNLDWNAAIASDGFFWSWGSHQIGSLFASRRPKREFQVKDIALGYDHILILTIERRVLSAGSNRCGKLGRKIKTIMFDNELLEVGFNFETNPTDRNFIGVAAGYSHSFVWSRRNLFAFGENYNSQLGTTGPDCCQPIHVEAFAGKNIKDVQAKANFSAVLADNCLYVFGVLPLDHNFQTFSVPHALFGHGSARIDNFSCGDGHIIATKNRKAYTFGSNVYGRLGRFSFVDDESHDPREVSYQENGDLNDVVSVAASENSSLIQTKHGVYVCGSISGNVGETCLFPLRSKRSLLLWQEGPERPPSSPFSTQRVALFDSAKSIRLFTHTPVSRQYWFFFDRRELEEFSDTDNARTSTVSLVLRLLGCKFFCALLDDEIELLSYLDA